MATYVTKTVLFGLPPMSVYTDGEGVDWMPISYDSSSIAPVMGVTAGAVVAAVDSETAAMAPDGPDANWVYLLPVPLKGTNITCITYSTFMMLVMLGKLPYSGQLLDVGVIK